MRKEIRSERKVVTGVTIKGETYQLKREREEKGHSEL
jgi:hypothetical protein